MNELLNELIVYLKEASPQAWEILIKQVYVTVASYAIWAVALLPSAYLFFRLGNYCLMKKEYEGYMSMWELPAYFSYTASVASVVLAFSLLVSGITRLLNPEYYAIKQVLSLIAGQ